MYDRPWAHGAAIALERLDSVALLLGTQHLLGAAWRSTQFLQQFSSSILLQYFP